jgi:tail lysozyme
VKWTVRIAVGLCGMILLIVAPAAVLLGGQGGCGAPTAAPPTLSPAPVVHYLEQNVPMTAIAAAGVVGNLEQESGLSAAKPGGGLAQWIGSRWPALVQWDQARGLDPSSATGQLEYLVNDLQTSYHWLVQEMDTAPDPGTAAVEFEQQYEGAGTPDMPNRILYAEQALTAAASTTVPVSLQLGPTAACGATGPGGYVNPLSKATGIVWERTDQGVDASMVVGSPILALGDSTVKMIITFFEGEPAIVLQLDNGPLTGDLWYVSEQITPTVTVGQTVQAGETVAIYAPSGTAIEMGWWQPGPGAYPLGHDYDGDAYDEGIATVPGADFRYLLDQLGAGSGTGQGLSSGTTIGTVDYP